MSKENLKVATVLSVKIKQKTRNSLKVSNDPKMPIVYKTLLAHQDMTKKITFMKRIKER